MTAVRRDIPRIDLVGPGDRRPTDGPAATQTVGVTGRQPRPDTARVKSRRSAVAQRAVARLRLLAATLLLIGGATYRPSAAAWLDDRATAVALAIGAAALLAAGTGLSSRLARTRPSVAKRVALATVACDAVIVIGVVGLAGLPPRSLAVMLLLLPLIEAALWAGLAGLAGMWTGCAVMLTGFAMAGAGPRLGDDVAVLLTTLPILLLSTLPLAILAEHLVGEVAGLQEAHRLADDRAEVLGRLSAVTAELFRDDPDLVAGRLVAGARDLGATAAVVVDPPQGERCDDIRPGEPVAADGDPDEVGFLVDRGAAARGTDEGDAAAVPDGSALEESARVLTWRLPLVGRAAWELRVVLVPGAEHAIQRDGLELLAAHGRAALANAALLERLATLTSTFEDPITRDELLARADAPLSAVERDRPHVTEHTIGGPEDEGKAAKCGAVHHDDVTVSVRGNSAASARSWPWRPWCLPPPWPVAPPTAPSPPRRPTPATALAVPRWPPSRG